MGSRLPVGLPQTLGSPQPMTSSWGRYGVDMGESIRNRTGVDVGTTKGGSSSIWGQCEFDLGLFWSRAGVELLKIQSPWMFPTAL